MKIAYVTVRYGPDIVGGAEQACRQLAEHLAADGVDVSVHTTCAVDAVTWADVMAPGRTIEAGVDVHRYRSRSGRDRAFEAYSSAVLQDPAHQPPDVEQRWLDRQGPVCPDAVAGAASSGADLVVCTPYLYWPTVETIATVGPKVVLHPAAHDEAPIRLPIFARTFAGARGLAFYTDAERRLVERLWPALVATPQLVVGLGIDADAGAAADPDAFRSSSGLGERPFLLCLGRVDDGKGVRLLARYFATYKRRRPGPLALVLAGPVVHQPDDHPDVIVTGPLTEADKWSALAAADLFVNPSANESFSIVLLEAWAVGRPVLVNARCGATAEHARRSGGGLAFNGYATFEACLDRVLGDPLIGAALGRAGRDYVQRSFTWPVVTTRYRGWLERLAGASESRERRVPSGSLEES